MKNGEESGRRKMTSSLVGTLSLFFWIRLCLQLYIYYTSLQYFRVSYIGNSEWVASGTMWTQSPRCACGFRQRLPPTCWRSREVVSCGSGTRTPLAAQSETSIDVSSNQWAWDRRTMAQFCRTATALAGNMKAHALHCTCTLCNLMIWFWLVVQSIVVKLSWTT